MNRKDPNLPKVKIPDDLFANWQTMVNAMAKLAGIPAGLIMRIKDENIEVLIASETEGNPYHPGDHEHLADSGLYCETVIKTKRYLLVPDALSDPNWANNPDIKLHMISYFGFPILFPDKSPFGTLCILDNKPNSHNNSIHNLMKNFSQLIEQHLALLYMNAILGEKNTDLMAYLDELQTLRGLIPICAQCKKIKDSKGYWNSVEDYLTKHSEANFAHTYCPECYKKIINKK